MKSLHITVGFEYSGIYKELLTELQNAGVENYTYIPQHSKSEYKIPRELPFEIYSSKIIKPIDKMLYFTKIFKMKKDIEKKVRIKEMDIIHAHSLFSDGAVAYELHMKYNIPYIVAIRDTDVNQYLKKAKHLIFYAKKILINAEKIIFLSKAYKNKIQELFRKSNLISLMDNKSEIIPNGISNYWLKNTYTKRLSYKKDNANINLLFVGKIMKRKNIETIIKTKSLIEKNTKYNVHLDVIGEIVDNDYFSYLNKFGEFSYYSNMTKKELLKYYRKADIFIMPSITETFGLVYAEALSQALPIIYTKNQGFDKHFPEGTVGYNVLPKDVEDIYKKVKLIIDNYDMISANCIQSVGKFDWTRIGSKYIDIYRSIIEK